MNTATIDQLIDKLATRRNAPGGEEFYNASGLSRRLGIDLEDVEQLLDAGAICACGKERGGKVPFESKKLNEIRRLLIGEGLRALNEELQPGDDPASEQKFTRLAEAAFKIARTKRDKETRERLIQLSYAEHRQYEIHLSRKMQRSAFSGVHEFSPAIIAPVLARIGRKLVGIYKKTSESKVGKAAGTLATNVGSYGIGADVGAGAAGGLLRAGKKHPIYGHYMARKDRDWEVIDPQRLTGKVQVDRFRKSVQDEDLDRRDANLLRSGAAGAAAGALLPFGKFGRLKAAHRALIGAGLATAGYTGVRQVTKGTEDRYGDKSRGAKRAEDLTPAAVAAAGGYGALRIARKALRFAGKISRSEQDVLFEFSEGITGHDPRVLFGAREARNSSNIEFVAAHLVRSFIGQGSRMVGASRKLRNSVGKYAGIGAGVGAGVGGLRAATDDDPETGFIGGALKGALGGAAIGGGAALVGSLGTGVVGRVAAAARAWRMRQGMPQLKRVSGRVVG